MKVSNLYLYTKALALVGIILALYLLGEQYVFAPTFRPCTVNATVNCDAIISGPVAKTFGIPTPLIGLIGYIVIMVCAIMIKPKILLGMAIFGLVFCLWIGYKELFQLHVVCPACILCQLDMLTVFILAIFINRSKSVTGATPSAGMANPL